MNRKYRRKTASLLILIVGVLSLAGSCKKSSSSTNKPSKPLYQSTGKEGSIKGTINFTGPAQTRGHIDMNADAACAAKNPNATVETLKVKDGKLANVLVYIKDGATADGRKINELGFPTPETELKLDQVGCVYVPRVLGVRVNQKLSIHNSDETVHTTQAISEKNHPWFTTQQIKSAPVIKTFTEPEVIIPLKCTQHGWMAAFVAVFDHPFFAVTSDEGAFEIKGVPPGAYTLAAWHEKGPTQNGTEKTVQITVKENEQTISDFNWEAVGIVSNQQHSLRLMPVLELPMPTCH
jgi:hypothetical protein